MGISEIYIVKRDGKRAPFSLEKIKRAISKAFLSVGGYATDDDLTSVLSRVHISDGMNEMCIRDRDTRCSGTYYVINNPET